MYIIFFNNIKGGDNINEIVDMLIDIITNNFNIDVLINFKLLKNINENLIINHLNIIKDIYLVYLNTIINNNYSINYIK